MPDGVEPAEETSPDRPEPPPQTPTLSIDAPDAVTLDERESWSLRVDVHPDGDDVRLWARGLPPGAHWDERRRILHFRPDFIQGGADARWSVVLTASAPLAPSVEHTLEISVNDTVRPPWPVIVKTEPRSDHTRVALSQGTDGFLDAPEHAGRTFSAVVTRPEQPETSSVPVVVMLHGFLERPRVQGARDRIVISPHDPDNTYWWGYRSKHDGEPRVPPYTQRRVLHLLEWVLRHEPAADPERVFIVGRSMGGTGAATVGLMHARHFAGIDARYWQAIPRNHRPTRIAQLRGLWGSPGAGLTDGEADDALSVWDRMDLTRVLLEEPEARHQWLFSHHGKDDPIIHFGAAVLPSESTDLSLYDALAQTGVGHRVAWDEGGHGLRDPKLGVRWWEPAWDPIDDPVTFLRRDRALIGFAKASHDDEPGHGGNGTIPWDSQTGYAGSVESSHDTGWDGDRSGMRNRFLRWDARAIEDAPSRFAVPLGVEPGYGGPLPITVDVSLRRVQAFSCRSGERVDWRLGEHSGQAVADKYGGVTLAKVPLTQRWQTLVVTRAEPRTVGAPDAVPERPVPS